MLKQPITQVRLTNVAVIRLKRTGKRFEIACYKNKILNWRAGSETDISEVLQTDSIFANVSKGQLARVQDLQSVFGTKDTLTIAKIILEKGELQVSEKEREMTIQQTFRDVCTIVTDRVFNRQTGLPLPLSMVESSLSSLGFSISIDIAPKRQSLKAIDLLCKELPQQIARTQMSLKITISVHQTTEVKEILVTKMYAMITNEQTTTPQQTPAKDVSTCKSLVTTDVEKDSHKESNERKTWNEIYMIQFLCNPTYYRDVDHLVTHELNPPGTIQILSSRECIINPNEPTMIFETPKNPSTNAINETEPKLISPKSENFSVPSDNSGSTSVPCRTCEIQIESSGAYRIHCKTKWHQFNVKRKFKKLAAVSVEEFQELADDVAKGFLAVD